MASDPSRPGTLKWVIFHVTESPGASRPARDRVGAPVAETVTLA
jgi:hypothetical protein